MAQPSSWPWWDPECAPGWAGLQDHRPRWEPERELQSVSPFPGIGKHRHVRVFPDKCLQAQRGQTPPRRPPARSPLSAGATASPQLHRFNAFVGRPGGRRLPGGTAAAPQPRATRRPGGRGRGEGRGGGAPPGAQGAGVRAHAVRGGRGRPPRRAAGAPGEPPTSPRRAPTAGAWMRRRPPSWGGRGATRDGDTRR